VNSVCTPCLDKNVFGSVKGLYIYIPLENELEEPPGGRGKINTKINKTRA